MKILQFITAIMITFLFACQTRNMSTTDAIKIPKLLIREQVIGPEQEMAFVLDLYEDLAGKIKTNPDDLASKLTLAELFMQEARISGEHGHYYPAALQMITEVLNDNPQTDMKFRALLDKAAVLMSLHQFPEAKSFAEEALAMNAYSSDVYGVLVDACVELGKYNEAVTMADKMVSIRPDLRSYSRVSYLREIHGDVDGAIAAMKLAVEAGYPGMEQTEWARLTLGHLYEHYGSLDSAMLQYETALSFRPNYPFAIAALANAYAAAGDQQKADSLNAVACHLIPEVGFYVDRAGWEMEKGNVEKGSGLTKEILAMMADDEKSGHKMSIELAKVHLYLSSDPETALSYAMKEYEVRPDNIDVNALLAEIYLHMDEAEKAKAHLEKAMATGSKDPMLRSLNAVWLTKNDQREEAKKLLIELYKEIPYFTSSFSKETHSITL